MNQCRSWACVLGTLLLTGCASASAVSTGAGEQVTTGPAQATGHVTGRLLIEGGPIGPGGQQPGERPIPGTVTFTASGHKPVSVTVGSSGKISAWLPPGRYRVAGRSPDLETVTGSGQMVQDGSGQPRSVTVTAGHTTSIQVVFIVP